MRSRVCAYQLHSLHATVTASKLDSCVDYSGEVGYTIRRIYDTKSEQRMRNHGLANSNFWHTMYVRMYVLATKSPQIDLSERSRYNTLISAYDKCGFGPRAWLSHTTCLFYRKSKTRHGCTPVYADWVSQSIRRPEVSVVESSVRRTYRPTPNSLPFR